MTKLNIAPCCSSPTPSQLLTTPTILFDLLQSNTIQTKKSHTPSDIYISKYNEIRSLHQQYVPSYTDGSKRSNHTSRTIVSQSHIITIDFLIQFPHTLLNSISEINKIAFV